MEHSFNWGGHCLIGQAAVFAVVFSLMDEGSLCPSAVSPVRMAGVAVELLKPGSLTGVVGAVLLAPKAVLGTCTTPCSGHWQDGGCNMHADICGGETTNHSHSKK